MGKVKFASDLLQDLLDSKIVKKFSDFEKMTPEDLAAAQMQRERQFIDFIEACDPDDAALIVSIKDKKMPYPNITERLFKDAWPTLASTWVLPKEVTIKENG